MQRDRERERERMKSKLSMLDAVLLEGVVLVVAGLEEDGLAVATAEAAGRFRVHRLNVVFQRRNVVTVFVAVRTKGYAGVPRSLTLSVGKKRAFSSIKETTIVTNTLSVVKKAVVNKGSNPLGM